MDILQLQGFRTRQYQMHQLMALPQMRQALFLLQLPLQQLVIFVTQQLAQNPLCEEDAVAGQKITEEKMEPLELDFSSDNYKLLKFLEEDFPDSQLEWGDLKEPPMIERSIPAHVTLRDHLISQARQTLNNPQQMEVIELLIDYLDLDGYLSTSLSAISEQHQIPHNLLGETLKSLQQFDPPGIAASSLQDSLLIQLEAQGKRDSLAFRMLSNHYEELLHNQLKKIAKHLGVSVQQVNETIKEISVLNFHLGAKFIPEHSANLIPDLILEEEAGKLIATINEEGMPSIRLNQTYIDMLKDPLHSKETKNYIYNKLEAIRWLILNVHKRREGLKNVGLAIADKQKTFFASHSGQLMPLTMKHLSEELQLHESTIARIVSNKYVATPRGLFPLRSFFSSGGCLKQNGEKATPSTIQEMLLEYIKKEDKQHPLSDADLSTKLKEKGILCSRRTIAKYRTKMQIGNQHERRKF